MFRVLQFFIALAVFALAFWTGSHFDISPDPIQKEDLVFEPLTYTINDYFGESEFLAAETKKIVEEMTLEEKVGQLLMPAYESYHTTTDLEQWFARFHVGGVMTLRADLSVSQAQAIRDQYRQNASLGQTLPLFFAIDAEPSLLRFRLPASSYTTNTKDIDTIEQSQESAALISSIIQSYGYNLNFAPVIDSNGNETVISNRSYGGDAERIANLAKAFVDTSSEFNILTVAKHFPGHGSVTGDTHNSLQTVPGDLPELPQFRLLAEHNVPMVMAGHLAVSGGEHDTGGRPATVDSRLIQEVLREELGYEGLVVSDGMNMGALDTFDNLAVDALSAGIDILLMPRDIEEDFNAVVEAARNNEEFLEMIDEKVTRIVRMKLVLKWAESQTN